MNACICNMYPLQHFVIGEIILCISNSSFVKCRTQNGSFLY
jgi:hypothetical protein